ncbi:MAG: hypothetical protein D6761_03310 [Candidatus Dadabacteria bacterium]|nr:MAG: hypothetical protein D6761_03310 [Candidatus Dadabacteria bacterium]
MTFRLLFVLLVLGGLSTSGVTPSAEREKIRCKPRCWDTEEIIRTFPLTVIVDGAEVPVDQYYQGDAPTFVLSAHTDGLSWLYERGNFTISGPAR